ncbi:MAG: aspartate kinase [Clostridia bacterium]|nr:aspartate kinase [Clostridia bacterium]
MQSSYVKTVKFGGSSLADATQFKKVADIVLSDKTRKYVVPSAPGKRFDGDTKVTDMLYSCHTLASSGKGINEIFDKIKERYNAIIADLGLDLSLDGEFDAIYENITSGADDSYAASRGEYLNGMILAAYLGFDFIDAAKCIFFTENKQLDSEKTNSVLAKELEKHEYAVIPGFYGSLPNGKVVTFSRGGSDITGSVVARAVQADIYENWTDVSGFLMADPRIVKNPKTIDVITYHELRELAYMGATVLHEDAIFPVRLSGIPINIRNTNRPDDAGTMIVAKADKDDTKNLITGIAGRRGFSAISLEKDMMNSEIGFGRRLLSVLENHSIPFEHLPSGIDTMSAIVSTHELEGCRSEIVHEICLACNPDTIYVEDGLALIAVVGRGMVQSYGTAARVFNAVASAGINIRMIDQGSSEFNIILSVEEHDFESALKAIYNEFVR